MMNQQDVQKTYMRRFVGTMVMYVVLLTAVSVLVTQVLPQTNWNMLLGILPAVPLIYGLWAFGRYLDGIDELQRHIQFKAIVFAAGLTGILTFSYGLLEAFAGLPAISLVWVFPMMIVFWGFGSALYGRQYQ